MSIEIKHYYSLIKLIREKLNNNRPKMKEKHMK